MMPDFRQLVMDAAPADLPWYIGMFAEASALALARLTRPAPDPQRQAADEVLTPEEAAKIAKVEVKRIYEWARKRPWASRPTKRCLRIDGAGFRRWLAEGDPEPRPALTRVASRSSV